MTKNPRLRFASRLLAVAFIASLLSIRAAEVLTPCFLKLSIYEGLPGSGVDVLLGDPNYPATPSQVRYLRSFNTRDAAPTDELQDFGGRIEGFITPQESGEYNFFLRSDAGSQLYLSSDDTEANAVLIAEELDRGDAFMEPETFDSATTAAPIALTAGTRYFIMVLYKGSSGGGNSTDFAQVAWRKVGDATPAAMLKPIDGAFLSANIDDAGASVTITDSPANATVAENAQHTFTVGANAAPVDPVCIRWQRNGVNIPGATGASYTRFMDKADNGVAFRAVVSVPGASATSAAATITVTDDTTAPTLVSAKGRPNRPEVTLTFSERVGASAATVGNYQITAAGGAALNVTSAEVIGDGTQVKLVTDAQTPGTVYTVRVNNVTDRAVAPNTIAANSSATFTGLGPWLQGEDGFVVFEAEDFDRNLDGRWSVNTDRGVPSGGASMVNYNGAGGNDTDTRIEYDIMFTKTGTHILWYRNSGNDGNDDSAWVFLDGARPPGREDGNRAVIAGVTQGLVGNFGWGSSAFEGGGRMTFDISTPGLHTISLGRREDGLYLDKFVITTDPTFNPTTGFDTFGPGVTLREGEVSEANPNLQIVTHPVSTTVFENQPLVLTASATVDPGFLLSYQWQRKEGENFVDIPGAVGATYTIPRAELSWNGVVVRAKATSTGVSEFTDEATITVTPDTTAPQVLTARGVAFNQSVLLRFSEEITQASAETLGNYSITQVGGGALGISSAVLQPGGRTVLLTTDAQVVGQKYRVTINGVSDTASTPNLMSNATAAFYSLGALLPQGDDGLIVFEAENYDRNSDERWVQNTSVGTPSGGMSVVLPNGAGGNEESKLEYDLTFTQTGQHIIWYRAYGPSGSDDSAWLHINGARPPERATGNLAAMSGFDEGPEGDFVWVSDPFEGPSPMTFDIPAPGLYSIGLARREDGSYFDKFVITTDPEFDPTSYGPTGPAETREGLPPLPTIAITSPANNDALPGPNVPITVSVTANGRTISKVEFFEGANKIGESTAAPYSFTWQNVADGGYVISARVTDDVGEVATSGGIFINVGEVSETVAYEGFDYAAGSLVGLNGGEGWNDAWLLNGSTGLAEVQAGSLTYSDAESNSLVTTGGKAFISGESGTSQPVRELPRVLGDTGTTSWFSFIGERVGPVADQANIYPRAANIALFNMTLASSTEQVGVGNSTGAPDNNWALIPDGSLGNRQASTKPFSDQSFVVVRIDHKEGNDDAYLWVNPLLDTEPTIDSADAQSLGSFDFSFNRLRPFAGNPQPADGRPHAEMVFDELRIGTTFAGVAPFTPGGGERPTLTITRAGNEVEIRWDSGTLQSAPTVLGAWEPVAGATGGVYRTTPVDIRFFRATLP